MSSTIDVGNRTIKFVAIAVAASLIAAFVLIPVTETKAQVQAQTHECNEGLVDLDDPIAMNSVVVGKRVKTVHVEKELFDCSDFFGQVAEVAIFAKIVEDLVSGKLISQKFNGFLCVKASSDGDIVRCGFFPVRSYDDVIADLGFNNDCIPDYTVNHPMEANTVAAGSGNPAVIKTVYAEKEIFDCTGNNDPILGTPVSLKLEVITFAEEFEHNVTDKTIREITFAAVCIKGLEDFFGDFDDFPDRI